MAALLVKSREVKMRWRDSVAGRVQRNSSMRRQQIAKPTPLGGDDGNQYQLFLIIITKKGKHTCWLL